MLSQVTQVVLSQVGVPLCESKPPKNAVFEMSKIKLIYRIDM
uniref:Uncharacterized protein n=1 Tax=Anguilla anguilla TaxID=7936 RepID=A0A0E9XTI4_ANGAN